MAYILFAVGLTITFLYVASELLLPFAIAGLLAMLFVGLSNKIEKSGKPRWLTALIAVIIFLFALSLIIGLIGWQLSTFNENFAEIQNRIQEQIIGFRDWINQTIGISYSKQEAIIEEQTKAMTAQSDGGIASFALKFLGLLVDAILVIVYMYLLLFYRSKIKKFIILITPEQHQENTLKITGKATLVTQQYLEGLVLMILFLWVLYGIGFSIIGVKGAILFAILCGILEIIPFVGNLIGTTITVIAVVVQGGSTGLILGVILVYFMVQSLQTYILEPLIVGRKVNINPLFTIIALVAGELLWGAAGMFLAIPIAGIIKIACDHIPSLQPYGFLIGSENKIKKQ